MKDGMLQCSGFRVTGVQASWLLFLQEQTQGNKLIQGGKGNCFPITSSYSPWIQSSKKQARGRKQSLHSIPRCPSDLSLHRFPGPSVASPHDCAGAQKCWEAASAAAANRTPQVTEGILGPPTPGHHRVFCFVSNCQCKYVDEHFRNPWFPTTAIFLIRFFLCRPFKKSYWICYSIVSVLCFVFLATRLVGY